MSDPEVYTNTQSVLWLTPEGYASLKKELDHLTVEKRPEIAERIRESLQHGEFSEDNSELDEVKFEQSIVESRISELKGIFSTARILDLSTLSDQNVSLGTYVTVKDCDLGETFEVRIVASIEADPNLDLVSNESPMGTALYGKQKGEIVEVLSPEGAARYEIVSIRI